MWLLVVVFFSLTQDKFDIVPVCALSRVSFTYLHTTIYILPNEIPGYAPGDEYPCLSLYLSVHSHNSKTTRSRTLPNVLHVAMSVAWSFSGGVATRYVLPVLCMDDSQCAFT